MEASSSFAMLKNHNSTLCEALFSKLVLFAGVLSQNIRLNLSCQAMIAKARKREKPDHLSEFVDATFVVIEGLFGQIVMVGVPR